MQRDSYIVYCDDGNVTIETDDDGVVSVRGIDIDAERALVELGFKPSSCLVALDSAIFKEAESGIVESVLLLIAAGADVNGRGYYNEAPLRDAVKCNHADIVRILLENSADPNAVENGNWTALHWAAMLGHARIAMILLEAGADMYAKTDHDETPWIIAETNGHTGVVRSLETWIVERGARLNEKR